MISKIYDLIIGIIIFILILLSSYFPVEYFLNKIIGGKKPEKGWSCEHPNRPIGKRCEQGTWWGDFLDRYDCEIFCGNIKNELNFNIDKFKRSLKGYGYNFPIPEDFLHQLQISKTKSENPGLEQEYQYFYKQKIYDKFRTILMLNPYIYYTDFINLLLTGKKILESAFSIGIEKIKIYKEIKFPDNINGIEWTEINIPNKNIIIPVYFKSFHKIMLYIDNLHKEFFIFEPLSNMEGDKELKKYLKNNIVEKYFPMFNIRSLEHCLIKKEEEILQESEKKIFQAFEKQIIGHKKNVLCLIFSFFYMILVLINPEKKSEDLLNYFTMIEGIKEYGYIFKIFYF